MADDPRSYPTVPDRRKTLNGELPWYSLFRVPLTQLIALGTILITLTGMYFKVQTHGEEIAALKATSQTKDAAKADQDNLNSKLDDLKERLRRIEDQQQQLIDVWAHRTRRP